MSRAAFGFGLSVGSGVLVQYLFVREGVGANLPVAAGALLATAWLVRDGQNRVDLRDAWCGAAALVFGVLCAVRTDVPLVAFDLVATLAFALAAIVSLRGVVISALPLADLVTAVARTVGSIMTSGGRVIGTGAPSLITTMSSRSARATGHLAGATLAIPFLLLFGALFSSADAVFRHLVENAIDLAALRQLLSETPGRMVVAIAAAWLTAGMCAALATAAATGGREIRRVLLAEAAITCLVVIDALFALFVALQVAYLFGGRDTVDAAGVTYSTYGRTGFFELVAVASVVTVLLFALDHIVLGRPRAYAAAALVLLMFTAVVLASATLRMWLYQQAYGWSELRFYAFVGIAYLAIALAVLAWSVVAGDMRVALQRLAFGAATVAVIANLVTPSAFVARANIERLLDPSSLPEDASRGIDVGYLVSLGDGALPTTLELLPAMTEPDASRVREALRVATQARVPAADWQSWNLDRERARSLVVRASGVGTARLR